MCIQNASRINIFVSQTSLVIWVTVLLVEIYKYICLNKIILILYLMHILNKDRDNIPLNFLLKGLPGSF